MSLLMLQTHPDVYLGVRVQDLTTKTWAADPAGREEALVPPE